METFLYAAIGIYGGMLYASGFALAMNYLDHWGTRGGLLWAILWPVVFPFMTALELSLLALIFTGLLDYDRGEKILANFEARL